MENISKHQAVWNWLEQCTKIKNIFFNFSNCKNGDTVLAPETAYNDSWQDGESFIDGSGFKNYDFAIIQFRPFSTEPNSSENIEILQSIEKLAQWIDEQGEKKNYPQFPKDSHILDVYALPSLTGYVSGADENGAKYMLQFRIEYLHERI